MIASDTFTAFAGHRLLATGDLLAVASAIAGEADTHTPVLILHDTTGRPVDLDLRFGAEHAVADYEARQAGPPARQGRGRPRLGVIAREVTLLPRHWEWLAGQPGGASAALRRLVEAASRAGSEADQQRRSQEALYRIMSALAGDLPGFEAATRALFGRDQDAFAAIVGGWPPDVASYMLRLAAEGSMARTATAL